MADFTGILANNAQRTGLDADYLNRIMRIESGGNPNNRTGSYRGLFQLSPQEFTKYGGTGNIFDPAANAFAATNKLAAQSQAFANKYGMPPSPTDLYMIHQQGEGGYDQHMANPDRPAWQNMLDTGEGRQKGATWAKRAIWGNVPDDLKRQFGSVDNITSADFMNLWRNKVEGPDSGGILAQASGSPAGPPTQAEDIPVNAQPTSGKTPMGGILGNQADPGSGGILGGQFPTNSILGYLAGALQGGNLGQSIGRGLEGYLGGQKLDQSQQGLLAAQQYAANDPELTPEQRRAVGASPEIAQKYLFSKVQPELTNDIKNYKFATANGYKGTFEQWKDENSKEFGLNPIYATDANNKPIAFQPSKGGGMRPLQLPEGVTLTPPGMKTIDLGTSVGVVGRGGNVENVLPKDNQGKALQTELGKEQGVAQMTLPAAVSTADRMLGEIEALRNHPGRDLATGPLAGRLPAIGGSQADYIERLNQLGSGTFLQAYQALRGAGAISNAEGEKATSALSRLGRIKSKSDQDAAFNDLREVIQSGVNNIRAKAGGNPAQSGATEGGWTDVAPGVRIRQR